MYSDACSVTPKEVQAPAPTLRAYSRANRGLYLTIYVAQKNTIEES